MSSRYLNLSYLALSDPDVSECCYISGLINVSYPNISLMLFDPDIGWISFLPSAIGF